MISRSHLLHVIALHMPCSYQRVVWHMRGNQPTIRPMVNMREYHGYQDNWQSTFKG